MKVFITGIGGLLGSRLADWIIKNRPGVQVVGFDDYSCGYKQNVPAKAITYDYSLGGDDSFFVRACRKQKPDLVYHFAAYAAEGLSPFIRRYNYTNNLLATAEVVNGCIEGDVGRLVFTSSMAVYGEQAPPFSERLDRRPIDPYGVAKSSAEQDIEIAGRQHGLGWTIIRPHNVFGINQDIWTPFRNVLGIWMARSMSGQTLRVYGDGKQERAFSWIDDCLLPLWVAGTEPQALKQIINLGGTKAISIGDAARIVKQTTGASTIERCEPRHEVKYAYSTWQKSVDLLGYEDKTDFRDAVTKMWEWAKAAWQQFPERRTKSRFAIETKKGLYGFWKESVVCENGVAPTT